MKDLIFFEKGICVVFTHKGFDRFKMIPLDSSIKEMEDAIRQEVE